jgi:hypothetical protein
MDQIPSGGVDPKARSREPSKLSGEDSRKRRENQGT